MHIIIKLTCLAAMLAYASLKVPNTSAPIPPLAPNMIDCATAISCISELTTAADSDTRIKCFDERVGQFEAYTNARFDMADRRTDKHEQMLYALIAKVESHGEMLKSNGSMLEQILAKLNQPAKR